MRTFLAIPFARRAVLLAALLGAADVLAQSDGGAEPSAEEMKEIERALAADAPPTSAPTAAPTSAPTMAGAAPGGFSIQSLNPDIAVIADVALAGFSSLHPLQTGGHDPTKNGFNLQQLELSIGSSVDPYFRFDSNIVFSLFGVEVEEAYATTLSLPAGFQLRAGQFLTRFGRLNNTHPHAWAFVDQPFALGRVFGAEGNRGLGVEASYLIPVPWFAELVTSATDAAGESTARSFYGATDLGVYGPLDFQLTLALKQFHELAEPLSLAWGLSAATGPNSSGNDNRSNVFGADLYLKYRPLTGGDFTVVALQLEYFYRRRQLPGDVLSDSSGYAYLFWRFGPRWATALRYEFGLPATHRLHQVGFDPLDPEWTSARQRISVNLTFWPTEFSRLRLQGSSDLLDWTSRPEDQKVFAAFLSFEVAVGAHGAHPF